MSFKNELGKIKAAQEARKAGERLASQKERAANEAQKEKLREYSDQLSAYLQATVQPILEEVNVSALDSRGSIYEEKLSDYHSHSASLGLRWLVEGGEIHTEYDSETRRPYEYEGPSISREIEFNLYPPDSGQLVFGFRHFRHIHGSPLNDIEPVYINDISLKDKNWTAKVESEILKYLKNI